MKEEDELVGSLERMAQGDGCTPTMLRAEVSRKLNGSCDGFPLVVYARGGVALRVERTGKDATLWIKVPDKWMEIER